MKRRHKIFMEKFLIKAKNTEETKSLMYNYRKEN